MNWRVQWLDGIIHRVLHGWCACGKSAEIYADLAYSLCLLSEACRFVYRPGPTRLKEQGEGYLSSFWGLRIHRLNRYCRNNNRLAPVPGDWVPTEGKRETMVSISAGLIMWLVGRDVNTTLTKLVGASTTFNEGLWNIGVRLARSIVWSIACANNISSTPGMLPVGAPAPTLPVNHGH